MPTEGRQRASSSQLHHTVRPHLSSRKLVQAGDLLSTVGNPSEVFKPKSFVGLTGPRHTRRESIYGSDTDASANEDALPPDDFNLKEEVMSCIAKSIGLIQPPSVGDESLESPLLSASDAGGSLFRSPYGSLSLLEMANDGASSITGSSSTGEMTGLDNEVEIRFFPAGSTLIHAGERNAGMSLRYHTFHMFTQGHRDVLRDRGVFGCDTSRDGPATPGRIRHQNDFPREYPVWSDEQAINVESRE